MTISIDGASLAIESTLERHRRVRPRGRELSQPRRRAGRHQGRSRPLVQAALGPRSRRRRREFSEAELPQRIVGLKPGDPAVASDIRAAADPHRRLFPQAGTAAGQSPVGRAGRRPRGGRDGRDHDRGPGPDRAVRRSDDQRAQTFDPAIVRSFLYIHPGDPYSPRARSPMRGTASAKFRPSAACASPKGRRSTLTAGCPIRSTSRTACPTPSARQ